MSLKVSISLPEEDVAFLDQQTLAGAFESRSAAVQAAVKLLRQDGLADAYAQAFAEWSDDDEQAWDAVNSDGLAS